ncbi:SRPBCC family protein [Amycolatopsis sp. NPDC059657]|uniref:SRPBCC family protein n=1 Tax=Amycolatopsis sp. NPDC059657 TaxID=3346899 RepID=UPI0036716D44
MTEVSRVAEAPPEAVFAVLADGWSYAGWVVGASHIRSVDPGWPSAGSRIHHSVGSWPLLLQDVTRVTTVEQDVSISLEARALPLGAAEVRITLDPRDGGRTLITMVEYVVRGPGKLLPTAIQALVLGPRNLESLARLAAMAEGLHAGTKRGIQPS